ncbi:ABC transporter permease (plasmid) [Deinococcus metallilatus]|nr:ABC transporter permease [Deinococcus metallilatus]RXJ14844.1 ABC transporter permease [Deinococcus metallilatus]TLK30965.1 ABC transporter permease [Deinococcus metallilatus]
MGVLRLKQEAHAVRPGWARDTRRRAWPWPPPWSSWFTACWTCGMTSHERRHGRNTAPWSRGKASMLLGSSNAVGLRLSLVSLLVGGLTALNTVTMGVIERTREFGTLRAIGARPAFLRALVLTESLLLALLGGAAGMLLGLVGAWGVNLYTQNLAGIDAATVTPRLAVLSAGVSLLLGLLAGLRPARAEGRLTVSGALRRP